MKSAKRPAQKANGGPPPKKTKPVEESDSSEEEEEGEKGVEKLEEGDGL